MDDRNLYVGNPEYGVIVDFLRGDRPDWDNRWLRDIRQWSHRHLEDDHHYIQWLFPLTTESEAVFAPRLREYEVKQLTDPAVREQLLVSLRQLLDFYGFALKEDRASVEVIRAAQFRDRTKVWMTPGNHNYRRISRIIGSLRLAALDSYAAAFLRALEDVYQTADGQRSIDEEAIWYWRKRGLRTVSQKSID